MLWLYQSNKLETLAQRLTALLHEPVGDPLQPETLVVQHPGMARWLSLRIADRMGICANLDFPQPAAFIWRLFHKWLPDAPDQDRYRPEVLAWRIHEKLPGLAQDPLFHGVAGYLIQGDEGQCFQLAQQLAKLYDRYLLYRPDWIIAWQEGRSIVPEDHWQGMLWRELFEDEPVHWVSLQQQCLALGRASGPPPGLPERISVFGVPTLSPGYLEILRQLSEWTDVHLFLLNPCAMHWADILSESEQARLALKGGNEALYLDLGHPLLASLGRQGRDFFAAINEMNPGGEELFDCDPEGGLLQRLQSQILNLEIPESQLPPDASISIHQCHSPMREVEVLYDLLLDALDHVADLRPDEILVMTPEIDRYAPLMEAVFGAPGGGPTIPFRISDTHLGQSSPLATGFLDILALADTRHGVDTFLRLLEIPGIRARFGLDETGLEALLPWLKSAAIRWGRDAGSRQEQGLPADEHNTWLAGIRQLLLGYLMSGEGTDLWQGVYPLDAVEGSSLSSLDGLLAFCDTLFRVDQRLGEDREPRDWSRLLLEILEECFASDEATQQALLPIREAIQQLSDESTLARCHAPVSLAVIRQRLGELFEQTQIRGFLGGGVNLCALAPMRSLPFRVVVLLGLNDGVFPRSSENLGFDLMQQDGFRFGDRSRRVDDRYLFLETLMSARDRLLVIYQGFDQRDNSIRPPSVVVEELRDCLHDMLGDSGLEQITFAHPLQPFSQAYFEAAGRLFSYSPRMREAALNLGCGQETPHALVTKPLRETEVDPVIDLEQLIRFFENPQRSFVRHRLGMTLEPPIWIPEAREIFALEPFQDVNWGDAWTQALLEGVSGEQLIAQFEARGWLPYGDTGILQARGILEKAETLAEYVAPYLGERVSDPFAVQLDGEGYVLQGQLDGLTRDGLVRFTTDRFHAYHLVGHWIRHLVLNDLSPPDITPQTLLLNLSESLRFEPVEKPRELLSSLIECYRDGLSVPTLFSPRTALAYVEKLHQSDPDKAFRVAHVKWFGNTHASGDVDKPYMRLLYPQRPGLDQSFVEISQRILQPLYDHLESHS
ncbi:MAG: exodeoxyribonuclease V subunit gamma [Candidatus Thiodiazotropha sp.]